MRITSSVATNIQAVSPLFGVGAGAAAGAAAALQLQLPPPEQPQGPPPVLQRPLPQRSKRG
ncbi:hypothetical protein LP420_14160 [Massilia sp. B-10]|nr:hypothetical protein LP420_14160 [Massilia sp. B-10]